MKGCFSVYPQSSDIIDYYRMSWIKGLVIGNAWIGASVAAGDSVNSWVPALKKAIREEWCCGACQTIYGRLNANVYSTGRED